MADEELQLKAQRSIQEYEDAVENLDSNFAELGQKCIAALDEFIDFWNRHPESPESRAKTDSISDPETQPAIHDMRQYVERQLAWGQAERERIVAQLSIENGSDQGDK